MFQRVFASLQDTWAQSRLGLQALLNRTQPGCRRGSFTAPNNPVSFILHPSQPS